jgi:hypothetical protein
MSADPTMGAPGAGEHGAEPSEQELRAAYEAELSRITTTDLALQAAVSLLNLGGRKLGLSAPGEPPSAERDLEQVRDAIDAVRALLEILERRRPAELHPLRDALSQLQMAYAREAGSAAPAGDAPGDDMPASGGPGDAVPPTPGAPSGEGDGAGQDGSQPSPGPAESSGRLWVPGR